jgi:hypothetical protein
VKPETEIPPQSQDPGTTARVGFIVAWTVASALGTFVGSIAAFIFSAPIRSLGWISGPSLVFYVVAGLCLGVAQGLVFPLLISGPRRWVPATAVGWGVGISVATWGGAYLPASLSSTDVILREFAMGAAAGVIAGIPQMLVLRRAVPRALLWTPISSGALALGFAAAAIVNESIARATDYDAFCSVFPLWGAVAGLVQAVGLTRLFRGIRGPSNDAR